MSVLSKRPSLIATVLALALLALCGCGEDDGGRKAIWGKVTWKGQPVPNGVVYFGPNVSKGNKGPQGFALIQNGAFDTRGERSKGCMTGPHIAIIHGGDGQGRSSGNPYGKPLFAPCNIEVDIPDTGSELNLTVPDSAAPAPVSSEPE